MYDTSGIYGFIKYEPTGLSLDFWKQSYFWANPNSSVGKNTIYMCILITNQKTVLYTSTLAFPPRRPCGVSCGLRVPYRPPPPLFAPPGPLYTRALP